MTRLEAAYFFSTIFVVLFYYGMHWEEELNLTICVV